MTGQNHEWRQVRVTFRKSVSDGSYGNESAEVTLEDWVRNTDSEQTDVIYASITENMLDEARQHVHAELERSPSQRVRSAIDHSVHRAVISGPDDDGEE